MTIAPKDLPTQPGDGELVRPEDGPDSPQWGELFGRPRIVETTPLMDRTPNDGFDFEGPLADVKAAVLDALKESCGIQPRTNAGQCTWCNNQFDPIASFKDELSLKEWRISGLCQKCQDATFDVFEDGPPEDECDELGVKLTADKLQELGRCGFGCSCCEYEDGTAPVDHAGHCSIIRGGDCSCEGAEK